MAQNHSPRRISRLEKEKETLAKYSDLLNRVTELKARVEEFSKKEKLGA